MDLKIFSKKERIRAIESMIEGIVKFMTENEHTIKSKDLLDLMEKKLTYYKSVETPGTFPREIYGGK